MAKQTTTEVKATHLDLLKDNNINVGDLPKATQDLISNFSAITDPASKKAMDEKIYGQIEEFAKKKNEKKTNTKDGIDVSSAGTAKAAKDDEEAARVAATAASNTTTSSGPRILKNIFGLKQ